jgi:hypothetical protein
MANYYGSGSYDPQIIEREEKRLSQPVILVIIIVSTLVLIGVFGWGIYTQIIKGEKWGDRPMSDVMLVIMAAFFVALMVGITLMLYYMRLITEVRYDSLKVIYKPFFKKIFEYKDLKSVESIKYSPLKDSGGWGYKISKGRKYYNIAGNLGVKIVFRDGKEIVIGSKEPDRIVKGIERAAKLQGYEI